jgi:hypothetical protein
MIETPTLEVAKTVTLDDILPDARKLSAYDKLVLARILVEESLRDPLILLLQPKTVIELYAPIEVSGNFDQLNQMLEQAAHNRN